MRWHKQIRGDHRAEKDTLRNFFYHYYFESVLWSNFNKVRFYSRTASINGYAHPFWLLVVYTCLFIIVMGFHSWQTTRECGLSGNLHTHAQVLSPLTSEVLIMQPTRDGIRTLGELLVKFWSFILTRCKSEKNAKNEHRRVVA
uniref:Uncharacterized protein n=1 Tax=Glossina palpalis gambiensis TaxID=67801 RepID=A0A1B0B8Z9_9MUSC